MRKSFVKDCSPGPGAHYPIDMNKTSRIGAKMVAEFIPGGQYSQRLPVKESLPQKFYMPKTHFDAETKKQENNNNFGIGPRMIFKNYEKAETPGPGAYLLSQRLTRNANYQENMFRSSSVKYFGDGFYLQKRLKQLVPFVHQAVKYNQLN